MEKDGRWLLYAENLSEEVTPNLRAKRGRADLGISGDAAWE